MSEKLNLVSGLYNAVVEVHDLEFPMPLNPVFKTMDHFPPVNGVRRWDGRFENREEVLVYFDSLIREKVIPKMYEHDLFRNSYQISLNHLLDNIIIGVELIKDPVGWSQPLHEDPRINILAGTVHLQDSIDGTEFSGNLQVPQAPAIYKAPSKKYSGSFWANMPHSHHRVAPVQTERLLYIIGVSWKGAVSNFSQS